MILDRHGNPIQQAALRQPQTARVGSLHQEFAEHPSRGLNPARLATILEQAEQGDMLAQLDLFQDMEEKDGHIHAELSKRRNAIIGLDWSIRPPRNPSAAEEQAAETLTDIIQGMDWEDIVLDMADAIGKGYACLEMAGGWQRQDGDWLPATITHRPQRWFQLPQGVTGGVTGTGGAALSRWDETLRLRDGSVNGVELTPAGWIVHIHKSRSGHLSRAGLHRILAWPYLFKNFSLRDLAEFLEIYGLPLRLGTYRNGASEEEKATLLRAVINIGHAAAGIVPEGMAIDFQEAAKGAEGPFMAMVNWAEQTVSKAILGATLTSQTGEGGGGSYALGQVHNEVRHDILVADARQIAQTLSRDLLWPLAALNGLAADAGRAPRWVWDTSQNADMTGMADALPKLVQVGVQVPADWANDKLGIPLPKDGEAVLAAPAEPTTQAAQAAAPTAATAVLRSAPVGGLGDDLADPYADQLQRQAADDMTALIAPLKRLVMTADSLEGLRDQIYDLYQDLPSDQLAALMAEAMNAAQLGGMTEVEEGR